MSHQILHRAAKTWIIPIEMGLIRIQTSSKKLLLQSETPRQKSEGITPDFCCGFLNRFSDEKKSVE